MQGGWGITKEVRTRQGGSEPSAGSPSSGGKNFFSQERKVMS